MQPKQVANILSPYAHPSWLGTYLTSEAQCLLALHTYGRCQHQARVWLNASFAA